MELACGQPWNRIQPALETLQATEYRTKSYQFFERNDPPGQVREIMKKLEISMPSQVLEVSALS